MILTLQLKSTGWGEGWIKNQDPSIFLLLGVMLSWQRYTDWKWKDRKQYASKEKSEESK
jgi:hypothetical protein